LKQAGAAEHARAVEEVLSKHPGRRIRYDYSYTMLPEARQDRQFAGLLRDVLTTMHIADHLEEQSDIVFSDRSRSF